MRVPYHKQLTTSSCGPAALQMVFGYFNKYHSQRELIEKLQPDDDTGTPHHKLITAAQQAGFYAYVNNDSSLSEIQSFLAQGLPVIVNFIEPSHEEGHYAVAVGLADGHIILNDPWNGARFELSKREFMKRWVDSTGRHTRWLLVISDQDLNLGKQYLPNLSVA